MSTHGSVRQHVVKTTATPVIPFTKASQFSLFDGHCVGWLRQSVPNISDCVSQGEALYIGLYVVKHHTADLLQYKADTPPQHFVHLEIRRMLTSFFTITSLQKPISQVFLSSYNLYHTLYTLQYQRSTKGERVD